MLWNDENGCSMKENEKEILDIYIEEWFDQCDHDDNTSNESTEALTPR